MVVVVLMSQRGPGGTLASVAGVALAFTVGDLSQSHSITAILLSYLSSMIPPIPVLIPCLLISVWADIVQRSSPQSMIH